MPRNNPLTKALVAGLCICTLSCEREEEIRVYEVQVPDTYKQERPPTTSPEAEAMAAITEGIRVADGSLTWDALPNWQRRPLSDLINQGNYYLPASDGTGANLTITVLPGTAGGLEQNINRWRQQLNLQRLPDAEIRQSVETINAPALPAPMLHVRIEGTSPNDQPTITEGGFVFLENESWFFKLMGPTQAVNENAPAFREFLQSVRPRTQPITNNQPQESSDPHNHSTHNHSTHDHSTHSPANTRISYDLPGGWIESPPGQMQTASFTVPGPEDLEIQISIVHLDGGGASPQANARLWRDQLGLDDIPEDEINSLFSPITETAWDHAMLFEATSTEPLINNAYKGTILAALLPSDDGTWIVRMRGASSHVAHEKNNFVTFVQSLRIP